MSFVKKIPLHWQIIIALIFGLLYAIASISFGWNEFTLDYVLPFGEIFIRLLKMLAVPLVMFSIISGISSLGNIKNLGRIGVRTLILYLLTTLISITIGLFAVNTFKPGNAVSDNIRLEKRIDYELWLEQNPKVKRLDNLSFSSKSENQAIVVRIKAQGSVNEDIASIEEKIITAQETKRQPPLQPIIDVIPDNIIRALLNMEMLQIIFFSILFGIVIANFPKEKSEFLSKFFTYLNDAFVIMIGWVIKLMPIFVFALMGGSLVKAAGDNLDKLKDELSFLGSYGLVVIVALLFIAFVVYPILSYFLVKGLKIKDFYKGISKAQITAFSTSSSIATLPVTMECVENNLKVSKPILSFVLPIGATVNMDGTSTYQAIAVVALAQLHMIDLELSQQIVILITATLASIGAAAVPSAGLVLLVIILESVGLNPLWIAIIFPLDRILDMCRTVVNVTGDAFVCLYINHKEKSNVKNDTIETND